MFEEPFDEQIEERGEGKKKIHLPTIFLIILTALLLVLVGVFLYIRFWNNVKPASTSEVTKVIRGTSSSLLNTPLDVALYNGKFYVTDAKNRRVVAFLENGEPLFDFKGEGHGLKDSALVYPVGIDINSRGEIYVADSGAGRVTVFNESGRALRFLKLPGGNKKILKPLALRIDEQDNIYVSEAKSGNIYQFDGNEKLIKEIGDGKLAYANGIAIRDNGDVYVADSNNQRILVFNQFGKIARIIEHKTGDKSFLPRGLALDRRGDLLVADTLGSRIVELNEMGHEMTSWGSPGTGREQFNFPNGMAYSHEGLLYVADSGNNRVVVWRHLP